MLVGWDDGKIFLYIAGKEFCISDDPELVQKILDLCRQHFERKANGEAPSGFPPNLS